MRQRSTVVRADASSSAAPSRTLAVAAALLLALAAARTGAAEATGGETERAREGAVAGEARGTRDRAEKKPATGKDKAAAERKAGDRAEDGREETVGGIKGATKQERANLAAERGESQGEHADGKAKRATGERPGRKPAAERATKPPREGAKAPRGTDKPVRAGTKPTHGAAKQERAGAKPSHGAAKQERSGAKPRHGTEKAARPTGKGGETKSRRWSFERDRAGAAPGGFSVRSGQWQVQAEATGGAGRQSLVQQGTAGENAVNLLMVDDLHEADVDLSVRLQAAEGDVHRSGGLVWRARDASNYYAALYDAEKGEVVVSLVENGVARVLQSARVDAESDAWHTMRVTMAGDRVTVLLDKADAIDVRDTTLTEPGAIGLWTLADAQTHFDDLVVRGVRGGLSPQLISEITGVPAAVTDDGAIRIVWPRTDVPVMVDGVALAPAAGLSTWAAFTTIPAGVMVMGDTVLFEDEVDAAMDAAFAHDLDVTALHNHFFFDDPDVYFLHLAGSGEVRAVAAAIKAVWDAVRAVRIASPVPARTFGGQPVGGGTLDSMELEKIVGHTASTSGEVVKITIGRAGAMRGARIGASMGLSTWAAFSGSDDSAAVSGEVVMTLAEIQPVLQTLRRAGLHVVALHNHMLGGQPAFFFAHFWGKGPAAELARAVRGALDAQAATVSDRRGR